METSSSTTINPKIYNSEQSFSIPPNLLVYAEKSDKGSLHLHSTTRRVFIGPTPANWSYKKKSLLFTKSNYARPVIKRRKSPRQNKNYSILAKRTIIKHEKQETFVASRDSTGPMNLSSLDYYEVITKSKRSSAVITDPNLTFEPQNLELPGPSNISNHTNDSNTIDEVYYTPTSCINTNPITPPNVKHHVPSPLKLDDEPRTSQVLPSSVKDKNELLKQDKEKNSANSERTRIVDDERIDQENNNIDHGPSPLIDENLEIDNNQSKCVRFFSSVATSKQESPNIVIKQNRMLVRIDYEGEDPEELSSRRSDHYFIKSDKWKEYIVKLKQNVIELFIIKDKVYESIYFTAKTKVSLFSSSDYTILITQPMKHYTKNIILNPKTTSLSIEWYQELYELCPKSITESIPCALEVVVPDLDVKLRIPLYDDCNEEGGGCQNPEDKQEPKLLNINAEEIINVVLNELSDVTEWSDVLNKWVNSHNLRLCWKRYERLEWIGLKEDGFQKDYVGNYLLRCPQFVEQTHQLQLRKMEHYPTTVKLNDGTTLTEPPPIEGYLIKITNNKGQNKKSRRLYFTSHNHHLFFLIPSKASPPPPPNVSTAITEEYEEDGIRLCDNTQQNPLIYAVSPYIQDKIVGGDNTFMKSDIKRRVKQIYHAKGFIDLIDVAEIKCLRSDGRAEENVDDIEGEVNEGKGSLFQLLMKNDKVISFRAYSKQTRKEWIKHLNELIKYWKARLKQDVKIRVDMIKTNQSIYRRNDNVNDVLRNWESFKSYVDPTLWNWCILDSCRGITKSGLLYRKTRTRQPFHIYHHILTRGYFLYFNQHVRSISGHVSNRSYHKRKGHINLRDCYVYSGSITEHEYYRSNLLQEQSIAKSYDDGRFVKIYDDGMLSYDDYKDSTFVIWKSKRRYYFSNDGMKINAEKLIRFGIPGNVWIFRARNKIECEEWVWALNVEIERLHREEN